MIDEIRESGETQSEAYQLFNANLGEWPSSLLPFSPLHSHRRPLCGEVEIAFPWTDDSTILSLEADCGWEFRDLR